jgi:hypothetical protein
MIETLTLNLCCQEPDEQTILTECPVHRESDLFFYNADMTTSNGESFISFVKSQKQHESILLYLATNGGDADAAYRMARFLKRTYESFTLCIFGFCKSAGTLLALGAEQLVMGPRAELGPLDVQVFDPDEFMQRSSGLSIYQALESLGERSFDLFEDAFLKLRSRSGGVITTQTAGEMAAKLVIGLYAPVTEQIDCARVGELQRSLDIVVEYGHRLGANPNLVNHLARNFPSHSFVIDKHECDGYFDNLREPNVFEVFLRHQLRGYAIDNYQQDMTRYPLMNDVMGCVQIEETIDEDHNEIQAEDEHQGQTATGGYAQPPTAATAEGNDDALQDKGSSGKEPK